MVNRRGRTRLLGLCAAAVGMLLAGCAGDQLPTVRKDFSANRISAIPRGAAPVYSWYGSNNDLHTYWMHQAVTIKVRAWFPQDWKKPGDEVWELTAENAEGRRVPFIGVQRRFPGENGAEIALLTPPLDLNSVPDCLYFMIAPNIKTSEGRIVSIEPMAVLCEIRNHMFKPFIVKIPLVPEQASPLTPAPILPPEPPSPSSGTPVPFG